MADYETFTADVSLIPEGTEVDIHVRDCKYYLSRAVRAKVYRDSSKHPQKDRLWVKSPVGLPLAEGPWAMEIIEELDEEVLSNPQLHRSI